MQVERDQDAVYRCLFSLNKLICVLAAERERRGIPRGDFASSAFVAVAVVGEVPVVLSSRVLERFRDGDKSEFLYVDETGSVSL